MIGRGLVVGKFAPLHRGHELVLNTALRQCREVVAISYSNPEYPGCEPGKRRQWLSALFPAVRALVLEDNAGIPDSPSVPSNDSPATEHRRFVGFLCRQVLGCAVDAVFTSEAYGAGFAEELTRYFREHGMQSAPVQHVEVDRARLRVPISATELRRILFEQRTAGIPAGTVYRRLPAGCRAGGPACCEADLLREFLSPVVYASFVKRICILGGESSGKSVLAEAAAQRFDTAFVPEYGRQLWEEQAGRLEFADLLKIARVQVCREEEAAQRANRCLLCDTSPLTTLFYSLHLFGRAEDELYQLANRSYDLVVLCAPDFPFVQDGTRQPPDFRDGQHRWYLRELERRSIPYLLATGTVEQRVDQICKKIG